MKASRALLAAVLLELTAAEALFIVSAWYLQARWGGGYGWYSKLVMAGIALAGILAHGRPSSYGLKPRCPRFSLKWLGVVVLLFSSTSVASLLAAIAWGKLKPIDLGRALVDIAWFLVFVGLIEELFFRGYLQSRLAEALGGRFRSFLGVRFEWPVAALVVGVAFFGLPHLATGVNPFTSYYSIGSSTIALTASACFLGVVYGVVREKTGDVVVPGVLHGLVDYTTMGLGRIVGLGLSTLASAAALFLFFLLVLERMLLEEPACSSGG